MHRTKLFRGALWSALGCGLLAIGLAASAHAGCQLNSPSGKIQHVVYVEFDNVHFTRDNPNVPSDLEQMPNLLNFIKQNGTLDTGDHAVLISHTANDILTTQTGLYSDDLGILIANSFLEFEPGSPANIFVVSSFFYWTDKVKDIVSGTGDDTFALTTPGGENVPAPWVPFTRAGCDVGAFSTANIVLERTPFDVDKVFGAGSPQATEDDPACHSAHPSCPNETNDFIGAAIHCANPSSFCSSAASNPNVVEVTDSLPDEPGAPYTGYEALFGLKYIAPALGGLTDYNGNAITGFGQLNFSPTPAQTLAVVESMLKKGIPVVFAYIADAHDNHAGFGTFGPGQAAYVQQLKDYDAAFGKFFANLKSAGIDQSNTLFIFTPDEGDHFVGGAPSPAKCDGVTTACTYPPGPPPMGMNPGVGEVDLDLNKVVTDAGNMTSFTYHFDDAATVFVPGQPGPTDPSVRGLEHTMAGLTAVNPHTGMNESLLGTNMGPELRGAMVDPVGQKLLHMDTEADLNASGVSVREPTFTFFGNPDFFFEAARGVSDVPVVGPGFAWNHGDIQHEIAETFIAIAGPGVRNLGVTKPADFFTDHVDVRPTLMFLTGLTDDYEHDGRVILELLDPKILSSTLHAHSNTLLRLGQIYKQINAPFGALAESTLTTSTYALESNSPGDATYTNLESQIASWTTQRDGLTAQIKSMLEAAEFNGQAIDEQQAKPIVSEGQALLNQASACASNPGNC